MFKNVEWSILICALILSAIGLVALFSATAQTEYDDFKKQAIWLGISFLIMIIVMFTDYEVLARVSPIAYITCLILLVAVLFTKPINGATSWFDIGSFSLQPAEFAKVFVIISLAYVMYKLQERGKNEINKPWKLMLSILVVAVPVALIFKQPDLGTASAYLTAMILMLFVAGLDKKYIIVSLILVAIAVPLIYQFVLPEHAKSRIEIFLNPESDPRGAGYNIIQSKLAIGAGQLTGMGLLKGNQTQLGFLYPKTTDFIFAVIGEEMGFIVAGAVILLNVFLVGKSLYIAKTAKDDIGSYIATGIAGVFLFHMLENIGMTMGLLPITGVPLPFISYGGSSLITNFICIGVLLNISGKRQRTIFIK
jgi:rod shape determining protein RodA